MITYRSPGAGSRGAKTPGLACRGGTLAKPWGQVATAAGPQGVDGPQDTAQAQLLMQSSQASVLLLQVPCMHRWSQEGGKQAKVVRCCDSYQMQLPITCNAAALNAYAFLPHTRGDNRCAGVRDNSTTERSLFWTVWAKIQQE